MHSLHPNITFKQTCQRRIPKQWRFKKLREMKVLRMKLMSKKEDTPHESDL
jgi:hypothetical protein